MLAIVAVAWLAVMAMVVALCVLAKTGDAALADSRPQLRLVQGTPGTVAVPARTRSTVLH